MRLMMKIPTHSTPCLMGALLSLATLACGDDTPTPEAVTCTVVQTTAGARLTCSDGSSLVLGDGRSGENAEGFLLLVETDIVQPGDECTAGGIEVRAGQDRDNDQRIASSELLATEVVCAGVAGRNGAQVAALREPIDAGEICETGGERLSFGEDSDGNGVLTQSEVEVSAILCQPRFELCSADHVVVDDQCIPFHIAEITATVTAVSAVTGSAFVDVAIGDQITGSFSHKWEHEEFALRNSSGERVYVYTYADGDATLAWSIGDTTLRSSLRGELRLGTFDPFGAANLGMQARFMSDDDVRSVEMTGYVPSPEPDTTLPNFRPPAPEVLAMFDPWTITLTDETGSSLTLVVDATSRGR